jgi:hypothetical protein
MKTMIICLKTDKNKKGVENIYLSSGKQIKQTHCTQGLNPSCPLPLSPTTTLFPPT